MSKRWATAVIIILILVFIGYIIFDVALKKDYPRDNKTIPDSSAPADMWSVSRIFDRTAGQLNAVAVSENGTVFLGGKNFVSCYDPDFNLQWEYKSDLPVTAMTFSGSILYASTQETILVLDTRGEKVDEWGPFGDKSYITSLSANETGLAVADAANKTVLILDKKGVLKSLIGKSEEPFIIPSLYFDVVLNSDNTLLVANTGKWRIERRNSDGKLLDYIGEPGTDPGHFCGCCNPAQFTVIPDGFITAEKGINRIKILNTRGEFIELVSSVNDFSRPVPLDVASPDGKTIYAANPADSKLYVFKRKESNEQK